MKSEPIYTEEQFQECLNKELKEAIDVIEKHKKYISLLESKNEQLLKSDRLCNDRFSELRMATHTMRFKSEICTYRPYAIKDIQQQIINEMDKEDCIKYDDLEDGTVMASVRVLDWRNRKVLRFVE